MTTQRPTTIKVRYVEMRYEISRKTGKLGRWMIWRLPRRVVYWCAIRVIANATVGEWSDQVVPSLSALESLDRWSSS